MFKDLNINRDMILNSIDNFCKNNFKNYKISNIIEKGPTRRRVELECDGKNLYIDFQYGNGGTTIETHGGKYLDIKKEIATYIIKDSSCQIKNLEDKDSKFIAEGILEEDFNSIIDLIIDSNYYKSHLYKKHEYHYQCTFKGSYNENLTVSYYFTKDKVMVQGRPLLLFYDTVTLITELLDPDDVTDVFNKMHELNIKKDNIIKEYDMHFPNSLDQHTDKLKVFLYQSIYNLKIEEEMFCYEGLVLPAFRALEGHIKILLYRDYQIVCKKNKFLEYEEMEWCDKKRVFLLGTGYINTIKSEKIINYINDSYNYYRKTRHSLAHYDSPSEYDPDGTMTRIISNFNEAENIIRNILNKMDEYYLLKREA